MRTIAASTPIVMKQRDEDVADAVSSQQHVHGEDAVPFDVLQCLAVIAQMDQSTPVHHAPRWTGPRGQLSSEPSTQLLTANALEIRDENGTKKSGVTRR